MMKTVKTLFYVLVATIFIGFIFVQCSYPSERDVDATQENLVYEGSIIWEKPDGTTEKISVPGDYPVAPGQTMTITTILPEDYDESTIAIRGSQQKIRFYIDGKLRSEYDTKDSRQFGSDSASRFAFCDTSAEDAGKKLRIDLWSGAKRYSGVVNELYCGNKADIWNYFFSVYGEELFVAFFILFAGIITIIFSIALSIAYKTKINLQFIGWCLVLGAVWMIGESKLRQLFISNASSLATLCFVIVMLCPIPLLIYVDGIQHGRYRKFFGAIQWAAILNLIISSILQMAEIADYLDTLFVSQLILLISFVAIFITFILDWRNGRIKDYLLIVAALLLGMLGAVLEVVSVYFVVSISEVFLGIGLLLLLFLTIINTVRDIRNLENRRQMQQIENRRKQTEIMSLKMIQTLSTTIEAKDEYTREHSHRVAEYSALLARELGWNDKDAENLKNAAHLHDIGKIGVPDTILNKPTKLLDAEYEIIKKHTDIGADILKNITLIDHVEEVARYHHERYDGHGYPKGLAGEEIPIYARIVAVADSYDAMSSRRIYRNALTKQQIREEIVKNRGKQFDPAVVDAFLRLFDENRLEIEAVSEPEATGTREASMFISGVMDTMQSRTDTENMDFLTGLPMRNLGEKQISKSMQKHAGCLVFLDMDNLKKINDIYGHKSGDRALKLLGNTISGYAEHSNICRLGGDEFLFFLPDIEKEAVEEIVKEIFAAFYEKKEEDPEIKAASLSCGLCMCPQGAPFADCYSKADKALYYVKQNGKNDYSFYHQIEQADAKLGMEGRDLQQIAKALCDSGTYEGALDLDNREFSKIYEYMNNLGKRYQHTCHLVLITMDAASAETLFIEKIEQALGCMEKSIRINIRNVDVCTRYSSLQFLIILMEVGKDNIPLVMKRIFEQYYKLYGGGEFQPRYEFTSMSDS